MATAAVPRSMRNTTCIGTSETSAPLATGDTSMIADCRLVEMPFTRMSWSGGTNWGTIAPTAGPCTAVPTARRAEARKTSHSAFPPPAKARARASVMSAIRPSESTMRRLRSWRSAHTPANGDSSSVGRNPQMMNRVIIVPERVSSVTYHISAYCTREVPSIDSTWLPRKMAVVAFHAGWFRIGPNILSRAGGEQAVSGTKERAAARAATPGCRFSGREP